MEIGDLGLTVYVNLGYREDRRLAMGASAHDVGIELVRRPGVPEHLVRNTWGFESRRRYACSLSKRLAVRWASARSNQHFTMFEDDLVFHREFSQRLKEIVLPDDWAIFMLGCRHLETPELVANGLVRTRSALDNHALVINKAYARDIIRGLRGGTRTAPFQVPCSDGELAKLMGQLPTYAAFPNLVWQGVSYSDTLNRPGSNYFADGRQRTNRNAVRLLEKVNYEIFAMSSGPTYR